jgi:hypothetical protein
LGEQIRYRISEGHSGFCLQPPVLAVSRVGLQKVITAVSIDTEIHRRHQQSAFTHEPMNPAMHIIRQLDDFVPQRAVIGTKVNTRGVAQRMNGHREASPTSCPSQS